MSEAVACENGRPNAALERLQNCQKGILREVLAFCEQHDLPVVMAAGTALGAARHGDIIPWDDDIDIAMMRSDLERFEALWMENYRGPLTLHSPRTERAYPLDYVKMRLPGTAMNEPELVDSGMTDGIFIDVFAFDHLPRSTLVRKIQRIGLSLLNLVIMTYSPYITTISRFAPVRFMRRIGLAAHRYLPWRTLVPLRENLSALGKGGSGSSIICFEMYGIRQSRRTIIAKDKVFPPSTGTFGGNAVPMPHDSEAYLAGLFGDWRALPPESQRRPPHARVVDFGDQGHP